MSATPTPKRPDTRPRESVTDRLDALVVGLVTSSALLVWINQLDAVRSLTWGPESLYFLFNYPWLTPLAAVAVYVVMVHVGGPLIKKVRAKQAESDAAFWLPLLKAWNLFLAWGSLLMLLGMLYCTALRVTPVFRAETKPFSLVELARAWLVDEYVKSWEGASFLWVTVFVYSKYFELFDTFLLVVRQKPVSFLHWYHHVSVLLFSWLALASRFTPGFTFGIINATVHTIMYWYYYRAACGVKLTYDKFITTIQIVQMVLGLVVIGVWTLFWATATPERPVPCDSPHLVIASATIMYGSYFYLFYSFYRRRYSSTATAGEARAEKME